MVSDIQRLQNSAPEIKTSYLFINPFAIQPTPEYVEQLFLLSADAPGDELCYVFDPLIYCTVKTLTTLREDEINELVAYYLVCLSSLPHMDVDWYQLDSNTDDRINFISFLCHMTAAETYKPVSSCSIIPMFAKDNSVGYMHHCYKRDSEQQGFIYKNDAVNIVSEIIKEFNISDSEIKQIIDLQEINNNLPKYFQPQLSQNYEL